MAQAGMHLTLLAENGTAVESTRSARLDVGVKAASVDAAQRRLPPFDRAVTMGRSWSRVVRMASLIGL
ncbi:hypothetical protein WT01_22215 [Burkholderia cepacia]|uniref:Uncharacterized protein n=1 Tax=Burkholderia cepacia TaxID=292 RepID=A0A118LVA8_BURCE|nr:hypothetical protein WS90_10855 [Burkholderia cepacia]KVL56408.1 hypothetical protein WT01_22215 [Burkholderia cepacia]